MFGTDLPIVWIDYADRSYVATRLLWFTGFMLDAPVHAHRSIELYLKAYLVAQGQPVSPDGVWGHDLGVLREKCERCDSSFGNEEFTRRVRYCQRYFDLVRYPSDLAGALDDGTGIWFAWDANILPLDEVVGFVRPRITFVDWESTFINRIASETDHGNFQRRALRDTNRHLDEIVCASTNESTIAFDEGFRYDLPGC